MTVDELADFLREAWPAIREQLLSVAYSPAPGLCKRLAQLSAMKLTREQLLMKLGAARQHAPGAWRRD